MKQTSQHGELTLPRMLLAGLAAGMAEVAWIGSYSSVSALNVADVARQITATVLPTAAFGLPIVEGIVIHLVLSFILVAVFVATVWRPAERLYGRAGTLLTAIVVLFGVWAFNFFVLLPALSPGFVHLMPYSVSLISKLLFGVTMASILPGRAPARAVRSVSK